MSLSIWWIWAALLGFSEINPDALRIWTRGWCRRGSLVCADISHIDRRALGPYARELFVHKAHHPWVAHCSPWGESCDCSTCPRTLRHVCVFVFCLRVCFLFSVSCFLFSLMFFMINVNCKRNQKHKTFLDNKILFLFFIWKQFLENVFSVFRMCKTFSIWSKRFSLFCVFHSVFCVFSSYK